MLNLKNELDKYSKIDFKDDLNSSKDLISESYAEVIKQYKNSTKQQFKLVQELEFMQKTIFNKLDSEKKIIEDSLEDKYEIKRQNEFLISSIIDFFDLIYNFHQVATQMSESNSQAAINTLYSETKKKVSNMGFRVIDETQVEFNSKLHFTIATEKNTSLKHGHIIKISKVGIIYNNNLIRKADVIVNKIGGK